jgi:hypothetical protein
LAWVVIDLACVALAQTAKDNGPDLWGHLPGALIVGVPLAIGLALYISRHLGREDAEAREPRRTGAVSRALARERGDDET